MSISGIRFCPKCGSKNVALAVGGITGTWMCKECGYIGNFPEKAFIKEKKDKKER